MTTDTAVRTTMRVIVDGSESTRKKDVPLLVIAVTNASVAPIKSIRYVDHPEIQIDKHESTQMPFRYIVDRDGKPIMPTVT